MTTPAIQATGLVKRYGDVHAVTGIDVHVPTGTVLAMLGPNGAGKTTTVRMLTTLLPLDAGHATVADADVVAQPATVRERIGVAGQYAAVDEYLTGFENLYLIGRLYHLPKKQAAHRARELLTEFNLTEAADRPSKTYSGGMRRRLDLAGALVNKPKVLFLDEPTTGLDPKARRDMWHVIKNLVADGTTLLLTTQYLEEADALADTIMVIDHGRVIAEGTSDDLKRQLGGEVIEVVVSTGNSLEAAYRCLITVAGGPITADTTRRLLRVPVKAGVSALKTALSALSEEGIGIDDIGMHRPTLDDVFLTLTGQTTTETSDN